MQSIENQSVQTSMPAITTALVVEGGAMRSVFSSGVLDEFINRQFNPFQCYFGVSAAAFNLLSYVAGESGHTLRMTMKYALDREFISYKRYFRGGHLLALDWLVENVLKDSSHIIESALQDSRPIVVSMTDVLSGEAKYVSLKASNLKQALIATMALPQLYRDFPSVDGRPMTDGGVADSIPIARAIAMGAKRIMVIRSRHRDYIKKDSLAHKVIRWRLRKNRYLRDTLKRRVSLHARHMELIRRPPAGVEVIEVCPPGDFSIGRFGRSRTGLLKGYYAGTDAAQTAMKEWHQLKNP